MVATTPVLTFFSGALKQIIIIPTPEGPEHRMNLENTVELHADYVFNFKIKYQQIGNTVLFLDIPTRRAIRFSSILADLTSPCSHIDV
jgi:hypothetical protein